MKEMPEVRGFMARRGGRINTVKPNRGAQREKETEQTSRSHPAQKYLSRFGLNHACSRFGRRRVLAEEL